MIIIWWENFVILLENSVREKLPLGKIPVIISLAFHLKISVFHENEKHIRFVEDFMYTHTHEHF